jgi:hypothetical protein
MVIALIVVSLILAAMLVYAAVRKLSHRPEVVRQYERVGVPERWLNSLAALLLLGAAGLVVGAWVRPLGVAASAALLVYFLLAVGAHVRARDVGNLPVPLVLAALAAVVLGLHAATR